MKSARGTHVILGAITPNQDAVDADVLSYPYLRESLRLHNLPAFLLHNLPELLQNHKPLETARWHEELRITYLLTAAHRLQKAWTPQGKIFWSAQITAHSSKLYGRPLSGEVSKIAHDELRYFEKLAGAYPNHADFFEPVLQAYASLVKQRTEVHPSIEIRYWKLLQDVRKIVIKSEKEAFAVFDELAWDQTMPPRLIASKFNAALDSLKSQSDGWNKWRVIMNNTAKLCVDTKKHEIIIGERRVPLPVSEVRGLFAHEVLVHAGRKVRGSRLSEELANGLPGQVIAEEGLGVLVEAAVNGHLPRKIKDRYIDIALAMGSGLRRPLNRAELYAFCYSRAVLRMIASGKDESLDIIERITWEHINRIYRGSLGNKYVGVFTKDVAYYKGFVSIAKFLEAKRKVGKLEHALSYVLSAKFDPTNPVHAEYIKQVLNRKAQT